MKKSVDKLKRLVRAQTVLENQARGAVVELVVELASLEQELEETQDAFSSTSVTMIFSDFYIGHLHRLQARCAEVRQLLAGARTKLQFETIRSNKLKTNLRLASDKEFRDREDRDNLERIERGLFRT